MSVRAVTLHNSKAIHAATIPTVVLAEWTQLVTSAPARGGRVSSLFARPAGEALELFAVVALDAEGRLEVARVILEGDRFPSMTNDCPEVHLFERELAEQWGVVPEGHPWLKPVRFHASRTGRDAFGRPPHTTKGQAPVIGVTDFYRVAGDEVHEVAVGPVHAGVIEPGHFRFQCHGEDVFHLEISLGYQHRGVEAALLREPAKRHVHYVETLAGDTSIGHATAYCQVIEALAGCRVPARALALRGVALELERLANHTGDLGALAGDVAYLPTASYCGRLRGDFLNMTGLLTGSRFGRGLVRPGGVGFDADDAMVDELRRRLAAAMRDVESAVSLLWETPSVMSRFEDTGRVSEADARDLGLVGVAARACGLERDVRSDLPAGIFQFTQIPVSTFHSGDVFARAYVRWLEIQRSAQFIERQLESLPVGATRVPVPALRADRFVVSLVEGWRGEICHAAATGANGDLEVYEIVDPSFHNWSGLAMALRSQQISDFPLCNKSFNLSYCGHDL